MTKIGLGQIRGTVNVKPIFYFGYSNDYNCLGYNYFKNKYNNVTYFNNNEINDLVVFINDTININYIVICNDLELYNTLLSLINNSSKITYLNNNTIQELNRIDKLICNS